MTIAGQATSPGAGHRRQLRRLHRDDRQLVSLAGVRHEGGLVRAGQPGCPRGPAQASGHGVGVYGHGRTSVDPHSPADRQHHHGRPQTGLTGADIVYGRRGHAAWSRFMAMAGAHAPVGPVADEAELSRGVHGRSNCPHRPGLHPGSPTAGSVHTSACTAVRSGLRPLPRSPGDNGFAELPHQPLLLEPGTPATRPTSASSSARRSAAAAAPPCRCLPGCLLTLPGRPRGSAGWSGSIGGLAQDLRHWHRRRHHPAQ